VNKLFIKFVVHKDFALSFICYDWYNFESFSLLSGSQKSPWILQSLEFMTFAKIS